MTYSKFIEELFDEHRIEEKDADAILKIIFKLLDLGVQSDVADSIVQEIIQIALEVGNKRLEELGDETQSLEEDIDDLNQDVRDLKEYNKNLKAGLKALADRYFEKMGYDGTQDDKFYDNAIDLLEE